MDITILQMSLLAVIPIVLIIVIRALAINNFPKKIFMILWSIVLCRLLIPFSIPSDFSAYNVMSNVSKPPTGSKPIETAIYNTVNQMTTSGPLQGEVIIAAGHSSPISPYVVIWLAVAVLMAAFFLVTHLRCLREYKTALPIQHPFLEQWLSEQSIRRTIQLRQSDKIMSPLTYGIWRPVILLPKTMDYTDMSRLKYILTHELTHIKRFDTLSKWILVVVLCIHWFNPMVWVMYVLANRDIELACDETVVRKFGEGTKSSYALTLIHMAESRSKWTPLHSNFSKNSIEERIVAIMKIKKSSLLGMILAFALVVVGTVAFATSPTETKSLDLFEHIFAVDDIYQYENQLNINEPSNNGIAISEDDRLYIKSTIFTDHHVYAIIGLENSTAKDIDISGRAVYKDVDQTIYGLTDQVKEIQPEEGVRYFFYAGKIAETMISNNEEVVRAARDNFLKFNSLNDHEGTLLELSVNLNGNEHILSTTINNVSTEALIFQPNANQYDSDFYDTIILTPYEFKMSGLTSKDKEAWNQPHIRITIVRKGNVNINLSHDTRDTVYDEGFPLSWNNNGYDPHTGVFGGHWQFHQWELDLKEVSALIIDGVTYRVNK